MFLWNFEAMIEVNVRDDLSVCDDKQTIETRNLLKITKMGIGKPLPYAFYGNR